MPSLGVADEERVVLFHQVHLHNSCCLKRECIYTFIWWNTW